MILETEGEPVAGSPFRIVAREFVGAGKIEVYLRDRLVLSKECADPPCFDHYAVPPRTGGATLFVIAKDSAGQTEELEFTIREISEGRMTAGA